jgi:perosamine synthetase
MIFHNKPTINGKEIKAVEKALKSGWIVEGKEVKKFEDEFCRYLDYKPGYAVALSSGTASLYAALISLDTQEGDEIIIPTYVCSALLNAIYLARAKPILVDINPDDFNISFTETKKKITSKTKAIIVPHIFGVPADIDKFITLNIPIIEDCAQAIGAEINGKKVGTFGKVAIFSFYASKILTTGYGGMLFSKDKNLIKKVRDYREFDCPRKYKPRFNFQMSDFQAVIGRVQLEKLQSFLDKRKRIALEYYRFLPEEKTWPPKNMGSRKPIFHRFLIRTNQPKILKKFMDKRGIKTIIPIESYELLHRYLGQNPQNFRISEKIAKTTLSLPIYPSLSDLEIKKIKSVLSHILISKNL